jgi:hypothetical protein
MKESHGEGPASHPDHESCVAGREAMGEALTGAHTGEVLSSEITEDQGADLVLCQYSAGMRMSRQIRHLLHHQNEPGCTAFSALNPSDSRS